MREIKAEEAPDERAHKETINLVGVAHTVLDDEKSFNTPDRREAVSAR